MIISIGSRNGWPLIWHQATSWSNDNKNLCGLEGALDVYELMFETGSLLKPFNP